MTPKEGSIYTDGQKIFKVIKSDGSPEVTVEWLDQNLNGKGKTKKFLSEPWPPLHFKEMGGNHHESPKNSSSYVFTIDDDGNLTITQQGNVISSLDVRGPQGETGKQGDKGPRGDQGIQGPQGVAGVDGNTWTPVMTEDKTGIYFVNNDGKRTEVYLVKGDRGEKGDPGVPGVRGERGEQGAPGVNGEDGEIWTPEVSADGESLSFRSSKGEMRGPYRIRGSQGSQGIQGEKGEPGAKGDQGEQGPRGEDAEAWTPVVSDDGESLQFISNKGNKSPVFHIRGHQGLQGVPGIPGLKGEKGNTFTPHYNGEWLWFEDEDGNRPFPPVHVKGVKGDKGERGKSAFELWRDDPLHPENATKTLDDYLLSLKGEDGKVVNTYHHELKELKDYTCPIQEINPNMIVSSDSLEGTETAEQTIELEKAKIAKLRAEGEKYVNHGSWIQEFFWWCAGADRPLLRMCPGEQSKYMGIGTVIFFTALMAWFSSFVALGLVTGESDPAHAKPVHAALIPVAVLAVGFILGFLLYKHYRLKRAFDHSEEDDQRTLNKKRFKSKFIASLFVIGLLIGAFILAIVFIPGASNHVSWAAFFACAWSLMIFFLDRFITNTMYSDGKVTISWLELRSALPRIVIAIFLGIVISAPLELIIFKDAITLKMQQQFAEEKTEFKKNAKDDALLFIEDQISKSDSLIRTYMSQREVAQNALNQINKDAPQINIRKKGTWTNRNGDVVGGGEVIDSTARVNYYKEHKSTIESYNNTITSLNDSIKQQTTRSFILNQNKNRDVNNAISRADSVFEMTKDEGLMRQLSTLHSLAYLDSNGKEIPDKDNEDWWIWTIIIFVLSVVVCSPFLQNVTLKKEDEKYPPFMWHNWWKGFAVVVPWLAALSFATGYCYNIVFFSLPCYIFSAVGMIMMLFILIDVSPVFYKMMLADGVYDKILHKEKLLTQDAMRLSAAKAYSKVTDSSIGRLAPFVFGETSKKIFEMLAKFKSKSKEIDIDRDGRPEMGYGKTKECADIEATNREVFEYVLNLKKRLVQASYLAWYRDMRDHVLGTKEDSQVPPEQPEDIFPEYDDESAPVISIALNHNAITLHIGEEEALTATINPEKYADTPISWESDNESVATIDESGVISAHSEGIANIIAKCGSFTALCRVSVVEDEPKHVLLDSSIVSLKAGETANLRATVYSGGLISNSTAISWQSDDEDVVTVYEDEALDDSSIGVISAIQPGHTVIRAKSDDVEALCEVYVSPLDTQKENEDEDEDDEHEISDDDFYDIN